MALGGYRRGSSRTFPAAPRRRAEEVGGWGWSWVGGAAKRNVRNSVVGLGEWGGDGRWGGKHLVRITDSEWRPWAAAMFVC